MDEIRSEVRADILAILDKVIAVMEERDDRDVYEIKEFSNRTIHSASIFQDSYSTSAAVLIYSLFKIMERKMLNDKSYNNVYEELKYARLYLKEGRIHEYQKSIEKLFSMISGVDRQFRLFIQHVIEKAKINKGSKLYEHGISMARASELMGLSQWELSSYVGKTVLHDSDAEKKISIRKRLAVTKQVFGVD